MDSLLLTVASHTTPDSVGLLGLGDIGKGSPGSMTKACSANAKARLRPARVIDDDDSDN